MSERTATDSIREELTQRENRALVARIAANPMPFVKWVVPLIVLIAIEFGTYAALALGTLDALVLAVTAVFDIVLGAVSSGLEQAVLNIQSTLVGGLRSAGSVANHLPTLLSREFIPNEGYKVGPNGPWKGTFLGLQPAYAWAIRFVLITIYFMILLYWLYRGWLVFREHYREAEWTPTDNILKRLRSHRWGQFGLLILSLFLMMAVFSSALGPTTVQKNIESPYSYKTKYYNSDSGQVSEIYVGEANFESKSKGAGDQNVGPFTYDDYGRYHPFGTLPNGRDLFTFMMGGARVTLMVSGMAITGAALIAIVMSMISAYYSGSVDLTILTIADGTISIPQLLVLIMVSSVFADNWFGDILHGGFLLACVFALTTWPFLWRAVRGPALQVAQEEWITAAKSYGQTPSNIMRKHMLPYILGYLLVYASMSTGGIIILLSALSFLGNGLGINPPTPAWGRAVSQGQTYVSGPSWHISLIPGLMIVLLVTGLNAVGDGVRDAIDPESIGSEGEEAAAGGGA
ncbi:MAG: ABC transporter permease [Halapricum sp.]